MKKQITESANQNPDSGSTFLALRGGDQMDDVAAELLGSGQIDEFMLDSLRIPAAGGTMWMIPGLEQSAATYVDGVIVAVRTARAFWRAGMDDGEAGSPPDCSSADGVTGVGTPGGVCLKCPLNQWGSASKNGEQQKGKACKEMRVLFLLREESRVPLRVVAPPSSLKPISKYMLRLVDKAIPYWGVVTRLGLSKEKSKGGIAYSAIAPEMVRRLEPKETDAARAYSERMAPLFARAAAVDYTDAAAEEI